MKLFRFDGVDAGFELVPIAARRALDHAGRKLSLEGFRSLSLADRHALTALGCETVVDVANVLLIAARGTPSAEPMDPVPDPAAYQPDAALLAAFGAERPIPAASWSALSALERYALRKVALGKQAERREQAYVEIIGQSAFSSHVAPQGGVRMVAVGGKQPSQRRAEAESRVSMNAEAFERVSRGDAPKGDVLGTARVAAIMAAKRTAELIPLCHPLSLTRVDVQLTLDAAALAVNVEVTVECFDRTGVEMEALTAASVAALTVYDMLKAFDRGMQIGPTRLLAKSGGRTGDFRAMSLFRVLETPLVVAEATAAVSGPGLGGIDLFLGVVRDHNDGRAVSRLEYHAYVSMAEKEMARIADEIAAELPGVKLAALHRIGSLAVGDLAVVCAAGAAHRDEAFRACRALIDRIKERVPIWKREHGPDGPYWVGWEDARCGGEHAAHHHDQ